MTVQDDIYLTTLKAKDIAGQWAACFIDKENNGEDLGCCEIKLMLLVKWIRLMESFYGVYFNYTGNITPVNPCLTFSQGEQLLAKIKALTGIKSGGTIVYSNVTVNPPNPGPISMTNITENFIVIGTTVTLSHTPLFVYGYYLNGQFAELGKRVVYLVGNVVTLDADYTGSDFSAAYQY